MSIVKCGLDHFLSSPPSRWGLPATCRIALLAHGASVDSNGRHAIERFRQDDRYSVQRILAPEHGLWGHEQDMETVGDSLDPYSKLPVISLYGADVETLRPHPKHLAEIDALVVDVQDVGSRYYTYVYTLAFAMETAAEVGVPVIVLDRPNPIGGLEVEGPILKEAFRSFVGRYPLPVRHGMTAGELANYFNQEHGIGAELRVVEMPGWKRGMSFTQTELPWVPPSPNMPTELTAWVYPGGCLIEGTELSEGRGTTSPFEYVGAPGLDGFALRDRLEALKLPGVLFRPASFRPMFQKHALQGCGGVQVIPTHSTFKPFFTYLALIQAAHELLGDSFAWREKAYEFVDNQLAIDLLLGDDTLRHRLEAGTPIEELEQGWLPELRSFCETRSSYLLYAG